jgi:hypothetical protein
MIAATRGANFFKELVMPFIALGDQFVLLMLCRSEPINISSTAGNRADFSAHSFY